MAGALIMFIHRLRTAHSREEIKNMASISLKVICQDCGQEQNDGDYITCKSCVETIEAKKNELDDENIQLQEEIQVLNNEILELKKEIDALDD